MAVSLVFLSLPTPHWQCNNIYLTIFFSLPLVTFKARVLRSPTPTTMSSSDEEEAEFDSPKRINQTTADNDDDTGGDTPGSGRARRTSRGVVVSYKEDEDGEEEEEYYEEEQANDDDEEEEDDDDEDESADDEEDDDMPLMSLKSPAKKAKNGKNGAKQKPAVKKKTKATKKKVVKKKNKKETPSAASKATASGTPSNGNDYKSPSFALYGTESTKGLLIQRLLCRWWYAITWPDPADIPNKPPPNCDAMDGFPGVYVCTQGEEVGTIKDFRNKSKAPNFNNFAKMTSEELRGLLIKAITEQKRQLLQTDGPGTATEKDLNTMLKWAEKLSTGKADKEAQTILKANKLKLPE